MRSPLTSRSSLAQPERSPVEIRDAGLTVTTVEDITPGRTDLVPLRADRRQSRRPVVPPFHRSGKSRAMASLSGGDGPCHEDEFRFSSLFLTPVRPALVRRLLILVDVALDAVGSDLVGQSEDAVLVFAGVVAVADEDFGHLDPENRIQGLWVLRQFIGEILRG